MTYLDDIHLILSQHIYVDMTGRLAKIRPATGDTTMTHYHPPQIGHTPETKARIGTIEYEDGKPDADSIKLEVTE